MWFEYSIIFVLHLNMRFLLFIWCALIVPVVRNSQVTFSITKHNYGEVFSSTPRYVDVNVTNNGSKDVLLFSIRKPKEVTSVFTKKRISPDSLSVIRFQVNPTKVGAFSYKIKVFTSDRDEATTITLSGNLKEIPDDNNHLYTACPSFGDKPTGRNPSDFKLTVVTIDKETKKELSKSQVTLIQKGVQVWVKETDKRGEVKNDASLGLSYFLATHLGYNPSEKGAYINFKRNLVVIELEKDTSIVVITNEKVAELNDPIIKVDTVAKNTVAEIEMDKEPIDNEVPEEMKTFVELDPESFDEKDFKPVNVVFVLDVSSSMKLADRVELMKYSLLQLSDMLRSQDKFSIVTYASGVRVLLSPTSGDSKEVINEKIQNLSAAGFTSGGEGIKLGFKTALASKINDGANHVIIITDGAFNRDSKDYKRYIKKYRRKGITFSVVGIKNKPKEEDAMREDANLGGGRYVPIMKLSDAKNNLKEEIRVASFIRTPRGY
ncbi:MAG: Ca-activated chloride channel family protein [Glaciecola sp.]|jgi:Ca-activated chloride channel family protein